MGRQPKEWADLGLPPLRQYWQEINRQERAAQLELRAARKEKDRKRAKCRCKAYPWPHRPRGGLCRWPDPPLERYLRLQGKHRPHRGRYLGILRQIARASGLHPIRDRKLIDVLMPQILAVAKRIKRTNPRVKYRNMKLTDVRVNGSNVSFNLLGEWQTSGPAM